MAFWIYVNGPGSWTFDRLYRGGPHEVSMETYDRAAESMSADVWTFESDSPPVLPMPLEDGGPLSRDDLRHGTRGTPSRSAHDATLVLDAVAKNDVMPPVIPCLGDERLACPAGCGRDYASQPALDRHVKAKHPALGSEAPGAVQS